MRKKQKFFCDCNEKKCKSRRFFFPFTSSEILPVNAGSFLLSLPSVVNQSTETRHETLSLLWLSRKETFEQRLAEEGWRNMSRLDKVKWHRGNFGGWWDEWCAPIPNAGSRFNELEMLRLFKPSDRVWSSVVTTHSHKSKKQNTT